MCGWCVFGVWRLFDGCVVDVVVDWLLCVLLCVWSAIVFVWSMFVCCLRCLCDVWFVFAVLMCTIVIGVFVCLVCVRCVLGV